MSSASVEAAPYSAAPVFAALGDRTRLSLLMTLRDGQARSIAALSVDTGITRQAVTKHLHVLQKAGLVSQARIGRESRFASQPEPLARARTYLDLVSAHWDDALSRLRDHVER